MDLKEQLEKCEEMEKLLSNELKTLINIVCSLPEDSRHVTHMRRACDSLAMLEVRLMLKEIREGLRGFK